MQSISGDDQEHSDCCLGPFSPLGGDKLHVSIHRSQFWLAGLSTGQNINCYVIFYIGPNINSQERLMSRGSKRGAKDAIRGTKDTIGGAKDTIGGTKDTIGGAQDTIGGAQDTIGGPKTQ